METLRNHMFLQNLSIYLALEVSALATTHDARRVQHCDAKLQDALVVHCYSAVLPGPL